MKALTFQPGGRGELTFARPGPDYVEVMILAPYPTTDAVPIPAGARFVIFSATGDFYAVPLISGIPSTVAVPSVTTTDGSASELNPGHWSLAGMVGIGLASPAACIVTLTFYS